MSTKLGRTWSVWGPLMMFVAMAFFAVNDAIVKWLSANEGLPLFQVLILRSFFIMVAMGAFAVWRLGWRGFGAEVFKRGYLLFGLAEVAVAFPYIYALKLLPLQTAQPIIKLNPLFAVLIAVLMFAQPSTTLRWVSVGLGMLGALVIAFGAPGPDGLVNAFQASPLIVLPLISATILGARDAVTNRFGTRLDPFVVAFSMGWTMFVASAIAQFFEIDGAWAPMTSSTIYWMLLALFFITPTAYVTRVLAVQHGVMSQIAPMTYTGMIWAIVLGATMFGDALGAAHFVGAGLIAAAGLILIWFDRQKR